MASVCVCLESHGMDGRVKEERACVPVCVRPSAEVVPVEGHQRQVLGSAGGGGGDGDEMEMMMEMKWE